MHQEKILNKGLMIGGKRERSNQMFRIDGGPWLSNIPNEKELSRLTVDQLLQLCKGRPGKGLKAVLVAYLMQFKKL
jgi:hypothetical protein